MKQPTQVLLESPAIVPGSVQLRTLRGTEAIGRFFEFEVQVVCTSLRGIDEAALLSNPVSLVFQRGESVERRLHGAIHSLKDALHTESQHLTYTFTFGPRAWAMRHHKRSEVFVDLAVPDILRKKIQRAGLDVEKDCDFRLRQAYPRREFVMQYEETDLAFCSRLCEHVGIAFFFEHDSGVDVLVVSDENSGFRPIEGDPHATFYRRGEEVGVFAIEGETKLLPARYVLKDYNYRTPKLALVAEAPVDAAGKGEVLEYGAHFATPEEGSRIAKIRAEELLSSKRVFTGKSEIPRIACGARFTLDGHPKIEGELLVTEVTHEVAQIVGGAGTGEERTYTNAFRALQATVPYRPARQTPKPRVHGAITAIVETAQGGQYAELDDQGRYHVRFLLDQGDAPKAAASSLLRMAQPHAGPGAGFHFPLRDGVEVTVACIDGDPDRPIITGAVPNPTTPSTVGKANGARNVIRTGGGTEINMDDTEGNTQFKITVPYAGTSLSLGAPNSPDGFHVGTAKQALIETGTSIELNAKTTVDIHAKGGKLKADATGDVEIASTGGRLVGVGSAGIDLHGNPKIFGEAALIQLSAKNEISLDAGAAIQGKAPVVRIESTTLLAEGGVLVTISSGGIVTISAPSVTVEGASVNVNGTGTVNVKGGVINLNT